MQNNKRYWLRGGAIGIICIPVVSLVMALLGGFFGQGYMGIGIQAGLNAPASLVQNFFGLLWGEHLFFVWVSTILIWLIVGMAVGWVYGKIRNKN